MIFHNHMVKYSAKKCSFIAIQIQQIWQAMPNVRFLEINKFSLFFLLIAL